MTNRLVTFGCSYAFGHGLQDCIQSDMISPGATPSKFTFSEIIASSLKIPHVNMAKPGSSNKQIAHSIKNFNFHKNDLVIVSWSHAERSAIIKQDNTVHIIGPWCPDKQSKLYYKHFYNISEENFNTEVLYAWSNFILLEKSVKVINTPPMVHYSNNNIDLQKYNFLITEKTIMDFKIDKALDGVHPGVKTHKIFAEYLLTKYLPKA